ncbi:hypothetical protein NE237_022741 [Protea cynaroides]|uniref:F-box protein n=1 Tax=Protea cynaroides TaxID=273540 RepID=A0A9Q0HF04_9MAGN|nr:hypothetical protein NE237_022741 [Protea cynaroides]
METTTIDVDIISPMNSNFSALRCRDTLRIIFECLTVMDLARAACVCQPASSQSQRKNPLPIQPVGPTNAVDYYDNEGGMVKEEGEEEWKGLKDRVDSSMTFAIAVTANLQDVVFAVDTPWLPESWKAETGHVGVSNFMEGFVDLLLTNADDHNESERGGDFDNGDGNDGREGFNAGRQTQAARARSVAVKHSKIVRRVYLQLSAEKLEFISEMTSTSMVVVPMEGFLRFCSAKVKFWIEQEEESCGED